ncbi:MAG TPA: enoyl-CoA hydratase/isomerase family protein [Methylomirabilota bacterium]|nr:enoyl-CoA hydratase/isomerase family protein [Methylomirabilota bacterium]
MAYETILYEKKRPVATITLNRPEALNAISQQMTAELHRALDEGDADPEVRAIILTGAGRGFSAGYDIARRADGRAPLDGAGVEHADFIRDWWTRDAASAQRLMHLWHLSTPIIAAVHGWVMGGGFWYSLAADITLAADNAVFAQPEVRHTSNTTILFAALAGWKAAHRYALTGDHLDAAEALRLGLVNEVVSLDQLLPRARALAERIARVPEPSVRLNKAVTCYGLLAMGLGAGMLMNVPLSAMAHASYDAERGDLLEMMRRGGLKAFLEARDGAFRPEPFGPRSEPTRP